MFRGHIANAANYSDMNFIVSNFSQRLAKETTELRELYSISSDDLWEKVSVLSVA